MIDFCTVADVILNALAARGIRHLFVLPGGGAMHLNDALARSEHIEPIACHHEQACAIAAEAYGRTGHLRNPGFGVCMVTTGPGATNAVTAVAGAWIDSIPLFVISGQAKRADCLNGRLIRQGGVQEVDIVPMVRSITKFAHTLNDPMEVHARVDEALTAMMSDRPGPVWLDVPLDVQAARVDANTPFLRTVPTGPGATAVDMEPVLRLLRTAERPLILAGHGVRLSGAAKAFQQLVDKLGIPTVLTWNALDLLPHAHPLNIGRPGVVAARAANFAVQNCDLLLAIGARLDPVVSAYNLKGFARSAKKVLVDIDPHELTNKADLAIDHAMAMDAGTFIDQLQAKAAPSNASGWRARCADWKARYTQNEGRCFPDQGPIGHAHFVEALSDTAPAHTLIGTGSSGLAIEFFYAGFRNKSGQRCFLTSGLGAMGYGLPATIGACLGNDRQPMIAVESDGSLQLNLQELATLVGLQLPVCLFVMNNGGYASIRNTQRNYFSGRYMASGPESGLHLPSLENLALAYGLSYRRIDDCANLASQLTTAMALARPSVIEVCLIPDETLQPKCAALPQPDGSMLSMPLEDISPLLPLDVLQAEMVVPLQPASIQARQPKVDAGHA